MNAINGAITKIFDVLLVPFEALGQEVALLLVSGIFGILALIVFKHISSQSGIKSAKDKIKGHMIEIRLYQDDLALVAKAIGKVLLRNLQYVTFNFGPILPLLIPFAFVLAQFVVRFAFAPIPVHENPADLRPGQGTLITVQLAEGHESEISGLEIRYPTGIVPRRAGKAVRVPSEGRAFQEVVAIAPGEYDITFALADGSETTKRLVAGDRGDVRWMQPERVRGLSAVLWPAEKTLDGAFARIDFVYPDSDLGWLPGSGLVGVMLWFLVASMAFGFAVLKPLGITI